MQELAVSDYKAILKDELATRCRQNPRYSLRAFARDLKLAPSRLSEILNGKQGLSRPAAERVAAAMGYGPAETERFCDLVASVHARSRRDRETAKVRLKKHATPSKVNQLHLDAFKAISDWYHFAILELTNVDGFKSDPRWIAKYLGISEFEVQVAVDRLLRLGLIEMDRGHIRPTNDHDNVPDDIPADSKRNFHSQILRRAIEAYVIQSPDEREFGAEVITIDKRQLAEAKKALRDFQHRFCRKMEGDAVKKDGLYCLSLQFFDLGHRG